MKGTKVGAEVFEFVFADAVDEAEVLQGGGADAGEFAEGGVGKDDVGGDAAFGSDVFSEGAEGVEEFVIDILPGDFLGFGFAGFGGGLAHDLHEADLLLAFEDGDGGFVEFEDGDGAAGLEFEVFLGEYALSDELVDVVAEFVFWVSGEEAIGGELVVMELADAFGVGAAKDGEDVSDAETLIGAGDGGEDFLCDDGGIGDGGGVAEAHVAGAAAGVLSLES